MDENVAQASNKIFFNYVIALKNICSKQNGTNELYFWQKWIRFLANASDDDREDRDFLISLLYHQLVVFGHLSKPFTDDWNMTSGRPLKDIVLSLRMLYESIRNGTQEISFTFGMFCAYETKCGLSMKQQQPKTSDADGKDASLEKGNDADCRTAFRFATCNKNDGSTSQCSLSESFNSDEQGNANNEAFVDEAAVQKHIEYGRESLQKTQESFNKRHESAEWSSCHVSKSDVVPVSKHCGNHSMKQQQNIHHGDGNDATLEKDKVFFINYGQHLDQICGKTYQTAHGVSFQKHSEYTSKNVGGGENAFLNADNRSLRSSSDNRSSTDQGSFNHDINSMVKTHNQVSGDDPEILMNCEYSKESLQKMEYLCQGVSQSVLPSNALYEMPRRASSDCCDNYKNANHSSEESMVYNDHQSSPYVHMSHIQLKNCLEDLDDCAYGGACCHTNISENDSPLSMIEKYINSLRKYLCNIADISIDQLNNMICSDDQFDKTLSSKECLTQQDIVSCKGYLEKKFRECNVCIIEMMGIILESDKEIHKQIVERELNKMENIVNGLCLKWQEGKEKLRMGLTQLRMLLQLRKFLKFNKYSEISDNN